MIQIKDKRNCCGCAACQQICPRQCISMKTDQEGFLYPHVNQNYCIDCGLCDKVCHELHPWEARRPDKVLAAINPDEGIRLKSSSGGIFTMLAGTIITNWGGCVFGAKFDKNWQVQISYTDTLEGLSAFRGSKYLQARIDSAYKDAELFLKEGRKVLFCATPCQIAGLHHFLRKEYDNLITVDFICHGTPSPKVWDSYLGEVTNHSKEIRDVQFRNKRNGWKHYNLDITYISDKKIVNLSSCHKENRYMRIFLKNVILRPSCFACKAKGGRSGSDITIADFWGIHTPVRDNEN